MSWPHGGDLIRSVPALDDSSDDLLATLAAGDAGERVQVSREQLLAVFGDALPGFADVHVDMEIAVLAQIAGEQPVDAFGLRVGHWRIDLPTRLAQTAIATSVLGGAIAVTGQASVSVAVLALILPFIVDVERVEVRTRDRIVRAHLSNPSLLDDPAAAYAALPDELRAQLTLLELADVLDRLRDAGELPSDDDRSTITVRLPPTPGSSTH